jgi:hypothetical protein
MEKPNNKVERDLILPDKPSQEEIIEIIQNQTIKSNGDIDFLIKNRIREELKHRKIIAENIKGIFNLAYRNIKKDEYDSEDPIEEPEPLTEEELDEALNGIDKPIQWLKKTLDLNHEGDTNSKITLALLIVGIYLNQNCQVLIKGDASSGKTHMLNSCINLMRKKNYQLIIGATGSSLKYLDKLYGEDIMLLALKELDGLSKEDSLATQLIKMMSSDDEGGVYLQCEKVGGDWFPIEMNIKERSFITTYAKTEIVDYEANTRMIVLDVEQTSNHTKDVLDNITFQNPKKEDWKKKLFLKRCIAWQQTIIPKLEISNVKVWLTCLDTLKEMFDKDSEARVIRDAKKFKNMLEIITILHHAIDNSSRESFIENNITYICSQPQDFVLACDLNWETIQRNTQNITLTHEKLLGALDKILNEESLPLDDYFGIKTEYICEKAGVKKGTGQRQLKVLWGMGLVEEGRISDKGNRIYSYRLPENPNILQKNKNWQDFRIQAIDEYNQFLKDKNITPNPQQEYFCDKRKITDIMKYPLLSQNHKKPLSQNLDKSNSGYDSDKYKERIIQYIEKSIKKNGKDKEFSVQEIHTIFNGKITKKRVKNLLDLMVEENILYRSGEKYRKMLEGWDKSYDIEVVRGEN